MPTTKVLSFRVHHNLYMAILDECKKNKMSVTEYIYHKLLSDLDTDHLYKQRENELINELDQDAEKLIDELEPEQSNYSDTVQENNTFDLNKNGNNKNSKNVSSWKTLSKDLSVLKCWKLISYINDYYKEKDKNIKKPFTRSDLEYISTNKESKDVIFTSSDNKKVKLLPGEKGYGDNKKITVVTNDTSLIWYYQRSRLSSEL